MTGSLNHKIAFFAIEMLLEAPFYGHLLSALIKCPSDGKDIALGVREHQPALFVSEAWLQAPVTDRQRMGAVKHELLHLIFRHPWRKGAYFRSVFYQIAADLVVNQYLHREEVAPEAITLELFEPLGLKAEQSLEDYYSVLAEAWGRLKQGGKVENASWVTTLRRCLSGRHPALQRHCYWPEAERWMPASTRAVLESQTTELLRRLRHRLGPEGMEGLPPAVQMWLAPESGEARMNWRRIVRLFAASSRKTRLKNTIRRPSKRYGTTPGLQIRRSGRLLVALDTSGSVPEEMLNAFFGEIHHLWRLGHELMIVDCDTEIRNRYEYQGRRPEYVRGRGATRYEAPLRWANREYHPDGILYFTDGQGAAPTLQSRAPLLWVIAGKEGSHLPGRKAMLNTYSFHSQ